MYAILLMNALVPFLNRATQPKPYGSPGRAARRGAREAEA
jgi:Na+-translocating ferredoxin:NAD+ oxidoreductase RnfD subunit